jgi:ABC-type multidrug transport system ATPase subunit
VDPGSGAVEALHLDAVRRSFGSVTALEDLSLRVPVGEVVGLLGHNGAGKTTTVRLLAGLLAPDRGRVAVGGLDPLREGSTVRRRLGVLPARPIVDDRLTGRQNLRFAAEVFGLPRAGLPARIDAALVAFDLGDRGDDRVAGYSTGMRQRLSLARVLLPDPEVLLLDEPTAALDPMAARQVRKVLADLATTRQRTIVLCTHDLAEAEHLCDRVVVLERGRVVADGRPSELAAAHGSGGVLLEVDPDQRAVAASVLAAATGTATGAATGTATGTATGSATAVTVEGPGRLRVDGVPRSAVPGLIRALVAAEVEVHGLRRLDPTLEEVYVALHERGGGAPAAPGDGSQA